MMTNEPKQLLLPLLFAIKGEPTPSRQEVVAERIRNLELVKKEQA